MALKQIKWQKIRKIKKFVNIVKLGNLKNLFYFLTRDQYSRYRSDRKVNKR